MIKSWWVICQVDMCAEKEIKMIVKANTERKARSFAKNDLAKQGHFHINIISCKEMDT